MGKLLLTLLFCCSGAIAQTNLLANNNFGGAAYSGWTHSGNYMGWNTGGGATGGGSVYMGEGAGGWDRIGQTVSGLTIGEKYTVTFNAMTQNGAGGADLNLTVNGTVVWDLANTTVNNWTPYSVTFAATSSSATITWNSWNQPSANYLSATSMLVYVPPPPAYVSAITDAQQNRINEATARLNAIQHHSIYIDQIGSNNIVSITQNGQLNVVGGAGSMYAPIAGGNNSLTIRQGDPANPVGRNLIDLAVQTGGFNTLNLNQGNTPAGNYTGQDVGNHFQSVVVNGAGNNIVTQQQNTGGTVGHYLEANVIGNYNTVGILQADGTTQKQVFSTVTGNNNTLSASQTGLGNHYLDVTLNGNGNNATVNQYGNMTNNATITLNNAGGPASVNLTQTGGQTYNIMTTCVTAGGCAPITVRQGN